MTRSSRRLGTYTLCLGGLSKKDQRLRLLSGVHSEKGWTLEGPAKRNGGMNGWCKRNYRSVLCHFCGSLSLLVFFHLC